MKSATRRPTAHAYEFTLVLSGIDELNQPVLDALFEAGCDDALVGMRSEVVYLDFSRKARSFHEAVLSAIRDVESAGIGATVVHIEPDELVTASEIARRIGRTRESVRKLQIGERGPGSFPQPISSVKGTSPLWKWNDVLAWFDAAGVPSGQAPAKQGKVSCVLVDHYLLSALNSMLNLRSMVAASKPVGRTSAFGDLLADLKRWGSNEGSEGEIADALQKTFRVFLSEPRRNRIAEFEPVGRRRK